MRCNVIVVTYNSSTTVPDLVAGLQANAAHVAQVTFVDNGSVDSTVRDLEQVLPGQLNTTIIRADNSGFAGGHWTARASFIDPALPTLCVNPDVRLSPGMVEHMLQVLDSSATDVGIVSAALVSADGEPDSASRRRLPTVFSGAVYSVFGKLLPSRLRYNDVRLDAVELSKVAGHVVSQVEATTGALMLVNPELRSVEEGIFDRDYFMYGEDLQLCLDARTKGLRVLVLEDDVAVHVKGVSSGWPRSPASDRAFHDAMYIYYRKNLARSWFDLIIAKGAITTRLLLSRVVASTVRKKRRRND